MKTVLGLALAAFLTTAAWIPLQAADIADVVALDAPTLGAGIDVAGREYAVGHLTLAFASGQLHPIRANGVLAGGLFVGDARLTYRSTDPLEQDTFRTNLRRGSKYPHDEPVVTDTVSAAILWDPVRIAALAGADGFPDGPAPEPIARRWQDEREAFDRLEWMPARHIVYRILHEEQDWPAALGLIHADKHRLVYEYDTIVHGDETLALVDRPDFGTTNLATAIRVALSVQAIGRSRLERAPRRYLLEHVDVTFVSPSRERAELEVRETLTTRRPLRSISLGLMSRRITDVSRDYVLTSVTTGDGTPLPYSHRNHQVLVELPGQVPAGTRLEFRFAIAGDILRQHNVLDFWLLFGNWVPTAARLDSAAFTYHAIFKVAPPRTPFSDGTTVRRWTDDDGLNCAEFRLEQPVQLVTAVAGEYETYVSEKDDVRVVVASYRADRRKRMQRLADNTHALLAFYQPFLGDYPFKELKLIEIEDYGWGQAPPGVIYITSEAFEPVAQSKGWSDGINRRLAHEMAHTWWGHVAKSNGDDQWLSESLAEYYAAFAMGRLMGDREFNRAMVEWKREVERVEDDASVFLANQLVGDQAWRDRYSLLYAKGPLMLHALRQELGDDRFFTLLKSFIKTFHMQHVETRELVKMTSWIAETDYGPWYDRYLFGMELPEIDEKRGK